MFRPFQCHFCVCLDGTFLFSAMKQVKQLKISGWPTIFGRDQKNLSFWPFLAFEGRLGGLKDPLEVRVQHETYRYLCLGQMYKPFWARKIGPGWRGCSGMAEISQNMTFALWVGHFWWKTHFFHFWSKLVQITQKWSQMVQKWCLTVFYHLGPFLNDLDQLGSKTEKMFLCPK